MAAEPKLAFASKPPPHSSGVLSTHRGAGGYLELSISSPKQAVSGVRLLLKRSELFDGAPKFNKVNSFCFNSFYRRELPVDMWFGAQAA